MNFWRIDVLYLIFFSCLSPLLFSPWSWGCSVVAISFQPPSSPYNLKFSFLAMELETRWFEPMWDQNKIILPYFNSYIPFSFYRNVSVRTERNSLLSQSKFCKRSHLIDSEGSKSCYWSISNTHSREGKAQGLELEFIKSPNISSVNLVTLLRFWSSFPRVSWCVL